MSSLLNYGSVEYWNNRYEKEKGVFEWYQNYSTLKEYLTPAVLSPSKNVSKIDGEEETCLGEFPPKELCKVLIVGCGYSRLGEEMLNDGWIGGIWNVDFSNVCIEERKNTHNNDDIYRKVQAKVNRETREEMNRKRSTKISGEESDALKNNSIRSRSVNSISYPQVQRMEFECLDVTKTLPYPDNSFDLIINKAALDAILCGNGALTKVKNMMQECSRVLKNGFGKMVVVSHGRPEDRIMYFENNEKLWKGGVRIYKVPKPNVGGVLVACTKSKHHHIYISSK